MKNLKLLLLWFACLGLFACSSGGDTANNNPNNSANSVILGTLPDGAQIVVSSAVFEIGESSTTTGSVSIIGLTNSDIFKVDFGIDKLSKSMVLSKSLINIDPNCILSKTNYSCQILIDSNSMTSGVYNITPKFTQVGTNTITSLNPFAIVIDQSNNTNTNTPIPGQLAIILNGTNIATSGTLNGIITLSNSSNISNFVATIASNNPSVATVNLGTCTLSSINNICAFTLTGVAAGTTNISANASNYAPVTSSNFVVSSTVTPGNLLLTIESHTVLQSESTTATISLVNSVNVDSLNVGITSLIDGVTTLDNNQCTLSSALPSCSINLLTTESNYGITVISAQATGYTSAVSTFSVTTPWIRLSGDAGEPVTVSTIYGLPTLSSIVIQTATPYNLWTYNGESWTQITGGGTGPAAIYGVNGAAATPTSVVMRETINVLWVYNGISWTKLTTGSGQPATIAYTYGSPTSNSIIILDNGTPSNLWTYDGTAWTKQSNTGDSSHPNNLVNPAYGTPTLTSIVMRDSTSGLWTYNGTAWTKLTGSAGQPASVTTVYGSPTLNTIIVQESSNNLWSYNGTAWIRLTGNSGQPPRVNTVYGSPVLNSMVIKESSANANLWTYNGTTWTQLIGTGSTVNPRPSNLYTMYGTATPNSIVMRESSANVNVWTYNGTAWTQITGSGSVSGNPQPTGILTVYGTPTPTSVILKDTAASNLWVYNGMVWAQLTGVDATQPPTVSSVYGTPTPTSIIISDVNGDLWLYDGTSWSGQTDSPGQPFSVSTIAGSPTLNTIVLRDSANNLWYYNK